MTYLNGWGTDMKESIYNAINRVVLMATQCGYTFDEALDTAAMEYRLDEFQRDDVAHIARLRINGRGKQ